MASQDDVDRALQFEQDQWGGFEDIDDTELLEAAVRAEQQEVASSVPRDSCDSAASKRPRTGSQGATAEAGRAPGAQGKATPVDVLAERLQSLSLAQGSGCITGPGMISGHPCPIVQANVGCQFTVGGIEVLFPFASPLEPQKAVMKSVLEALTLCKHSVLESPTGTGKTAAVLCAAIAWQRHRMAKAGAAPQIMYATRTHAQVRQAMQELRRTPYQPIVAVLGSREAGFCVNSQVLQADDDGQIRQACRQARSQKTCQFHVGLESRELPLLATEMLRGPEPWDIEDAARFATSTNSCPYYLAHSLARHAEIVFCPYSYVLDPSVRQASGLSCADLTGRIVILDEAHNVENVCRDAGSAELSLDQLQSALSAVKRVIGEEQPRHSVPHPTVQVASKTKASVEELGGFFLPATVCEASEAPSHSARVPAKRPQFVLAVRPLAALLQRLCHYLSDIQEATTFAPHLAEHRRVPALLRILRLDSEPLLRLDGAVPRAEALLREVVGRGLGGFCSAQLEMAAGLVGHLAAAARQPELYVAQAQPGGQGKRPVLHLWLMSAEGTLAKLANELHAFLLMSGTLSPLTATVAELGPTFLSRALAPVAANHVVEQEALRVVTVSQLSASTTTKLECTFHAWKRLPFLMSIGSALLRVVKSIPAGVLVFLPSYDLLERCLEAWQRKGDDNTPLVSLTASGRRGQGKARQSTKKRYRGAVERVPEEAQEPSSGQSILDELREAKGMIVVEPPPMCQSSSAYAARVYEGARNRYEQAVLQNGQAVLLAVYRGRMSEGVSFDDDFARGVVCIGIPFPNLTEERIAQKRACNDFWQSRGLSSVSGNAWYESKALHAVAQALGRCIRHPRDFGALVLLDSRWSELGTPSWQLTAFDRHLRCCLFPFLGVAPFLRGQRMSHGP